MRKRRFKPEHISYIGIVLIIICIIIFALAEIGSRDNSGSDAVYLTHTNE